MPLQVLGAPGKPNTRKTRRTERLVPIPLTAELAGSRRCDCESHGIRTIGHAPVLAMCRELLAAGVNPDSALAIYRQGVLALQVRSIREGAKLAVEDAESGTPQFRVARPPSRGGASSARKNGQEVG
jgi:hypothetical protein